MSLVGYMKTEEGTIKEFLPANEQLRSDHHKRVMFFELLNTYLKDEIYFSKREMKQGKNIFEILENKIRSMLDTIQHPSMQINGCQTFQPDISATIIIEAYKNRQKLPIVHKTPGLEAAKLITMVYGNCQDKLLFDMNDLFLHLVFERMKRVNKGSEMLLYENHILIKNRDPNISPTLVIPAYTDADKTLMYDTPAIQKHLKTAKRTIENTDIKRVFLVYPKNPRFTKHINITFSDSVEETQDEYRVKMIPYSFSFCIKTNKGNKHVNRNILRK